MKKTLLFVLTLFLMLPVTVRADIKFLNSFYNENVKVNDEVVVYTIDDFEYYPNKVEYKYDPTMLSITKDKITTFSSSDVIEVENGKISILITENHPIEGYGYPSIKLVFTALKAGTTEIEPFLGAEYYSVPGSLKINISEVSSNNKENETKPIEKEENKDEKQETKKEKNNDLWLYISLGANGLLFILLIISLLTRRNKKNIVE